MYDVEAVNHLLAQGTVVLQIVTVFLFVLYFFRSHKDVAVLKGYILRWGIPLAFVVSLGSSALTLFYSEVLGIEPCPLCWWQRVFLYPQVVLFAIALWKRDTLIASYSIALSFLGFCFAIYHHALQILPTGTLPCPATGEVSCAMRIMFEFGYITYPLMSATLFAFLIALMLFLKNNSQKQS